MLELIRLRGNTVQWSVSYTPPNQGHSSNESISTELPSDSVAQLFGAWQAICQIAGSSPSLSHCLFSTFLFSCYVNI